MKITISKIEIANFKGIENAEFSISENGCIISGANGTGKTTVADAYFWCLFGTNFAQTTKFQVARLDQDGNTVKGETHSVTLTVSIDGKERKFVRRMKETKQGGSTTEFEVDGYKKSLKEYNEIVKNLCSETTFRIVSSPSYFTSLKWNEQREVLLSLIESVYILPEFRSILEKCNADGVSVAEYIKKLRDDKKRYQAEIDSNNAQIVVLQKQNAEFSADFDLIEREKQEAENKLADFLVGYDLSLEKELAIAETDLLKEQQSRQQEINQSFYQARSEHDQLKVQHEVLSSNLRAERAKSDDLRVLGETLATEREALVKKFYEEQGKTISFQESDFKCPTCNRPFSPAEIEERQSEMMSTFNSNKVKNLMKIKEEGHSVRQSIDKNEQLIKESQSKQEELAAEILRIESNPLYSKEFTEPTLAEPSEKEKTLAIKIEELKKKIQSVDNSSKTTIEQLKQKISELNQKLGLKAVVEKNSKQITSSEAQIKELNSKILQLESEIDKVSDLNRNNIYALEEEINSRFKMARFKLFSNLVNGDQVETCIATYNGVPFNDLNYAAQVNVGLDIVRTISSAKGVSAPIFIDFAESLNSVVDTNTQQILLKVTEEQTLHISNIKK